MLSRDAGARKGRAMRILTVTISLVVLCGVLSDCSKQGREGLGIRGSEDILEGTGTIVVSSQSVDCSTMNACACTQIIVDNGGHLGPTNLDPVFLKQGMHVRFKASVTGQTYCGLGFDLPDYAVLVVDILEIEPQ